MKTAREMSNYEQFNLITRQLYGAVKADPVQATRLLREALELAAKEPEIVGRALCYAELLDFAYAIGGAIYDEVRDRFLIAARSGHGWKMHRMFKLTKRRAQSWGDNALQQFCDHRIKELKNWKRANNG